MGRLENLGDYNVVRDDLYKFGGDAKKLYKAIGDTAVAKERPNILNEGKAEGRVEGAVAAILIGGIMFLIDKGVKTINQKKKDKKLIENEPELKREFDAAVSEAVYDGEVSQGNI